VEAVSRCPIQSMFVQTHPLCIARLPFGAVPARCRSGWQWPAFPALRNRSRQPPFWWLCLCHVRSHVRSRGPVQPTGVLLITDLADARPMWHSGLRCLEEAPALQCMQVQHQACRQLSAAAASGCPMEGNGTMVPSTAAVHPTSPMWEGAGVCACLGMATCQDYHSMCTTCMALCTCFAL
jgi:hypothetical protein